jgi:Ca-activated chloride channel family protein
MWVRPSYSLLPCGIGIFAIVALLSPASAQQTGQKQPAKPSTSVQQTQQPSKENGQEVDDDEVISVSTTEVLLPVTVRDRNGRLVSDLTRKDFHVFEDEREQPLSDIALRQVPVDVILMVDSSSSVASNLDDFRRAVEGFAGKLAPDDRIALIKFDDKVELLQDWTSSRFQLRRSLNRISPGVFTRFNDALMLAGKEQFSSSRSRHAIIVLSDGIDSGQGYARFDTALRSLLESQATVYVVSNTEIERAKKKEELDTMLSGSDSSIRFNQLAIDGLKQGLRVLDLSEANLAQLTEYTGGRLYKPKSFAALDATYAEVADELRHQYAVYYTPLDTKRDGRFRRVRVQTSDPSNQVSARVGYFAPKR